MASEPLGSPVWSITSPIRACAHHDAIHRICVWEEPEASHWRETCADILFLNLQIQPIYLNQPISL